MGSPRVERKSWFLALAPACLVGLLVLGAFLAHDSAVAGQISPVSSDALRTDRTLRVLAIGINQFQDAKVRGLSYCEKDAAAVAALFQDPLHAGYDSIEVVTLLGAQATRQAVDQAMQAIARNAQSQDTVVLFFASHGIQQGGTSYWVLHDTRVDMNAYDNDTVRIVPDTALSQDRIQANLNAIKARRLVTLVDCCFSAGTVVSYPRGKSFAVEATRNPFEGFKGEGRVVITASEGDQLSVESQEFKHGVFTWYLLDALKGAGDENNDNVVELWEVWKHLETKVVSTAQKLGADQRPTISSIHLTHGFPLSTYPLAGHAATPTLPPAPGPEPAAPGPSKNLPAPSSGGQWVDIGSARMAAMEISNAEYLAFVQANPQWRKDRINLAHHDGDYLRHWPGPESIPPGLADHPVTFVSWFAAKAYAQWAGGRLPREGEWVAAARGSGGRPGVLYPFGAAWDPAACNSREGGQGGTAPARSYESFATRWHSGAILNMAGNVWEWCDDWAFALTGAAAAKGGFVEEPVGSAQAAQMRRLIKGGSFLADRLGCMVASRLWADPRLCAEDGGIRVVR